jgi:hypothetical protein
LICNISCAEDGQYTTSIVGTWVKISPVEKYVGCVDTIQFTSNKYIINHKNYDDNIYYQITKESIILTRPSDDWSRTMFYSLSKDTLTIDGIVSCSITQVFPPTHKFKKIK